MKSFSFIILAAFMVNTITSAQINWPDAVVYDLTTNVQELTSDGTTVYAITPNEVLTVEYGLTSVLHPDTTFYQGAVGGYALENSGEIYDLSDLGLFYNFNGNLVNAAVKGDSILLSTGSHLYFKLGSSDPVLVYGNSDVIVKTFYIMNGYIYIYTLNISNFTHFVRVYYYEDMTLVDSYEEVSSYSTGEATFLDSIVFLKRSSDYYLNYGEGEIQITHEAFNYTGYYDFALSYYGPNNYLCVTLCDDEEGNLVQIYTEGILNTENDITSYGFPEQTEEAVIDNMNHTVYIEVEAETDLTNLIAVFTLSDDATAYLEGIEQISGVSENDFSNPVYYDIEAENGDIQQWTVTVQLGVSIDDHKETVEIFPNPVKDIVSIKTDHIIQYISLLDIHGCIVKQIYPEEKFNLNNFVTDLSELKRGIYFFLVNTNETVYYKKIIKE